MDERNMVPGYRLGVIRWREVGEFEVAAVALAWFALAPAYLGDGLGVGQQHV